LQEKGRHIETLKIELDNAVHREQSFKEMHRNYMLQMQYLITQNVIASPVPKDEVKDEDVPVSQAAESSAPKSEKSKLEI
jgi:hypothetical protein